MTNKLGTQTRVVRLRKETFDAITKAFDAIAQLSYMLDLNPDGANEEIEDSQEEVMFRLMKALERPDDQKELFGILNDFVSAKDDYDNWGDRDQLEQFKED